MGKGDKKTRKGKIKAHSYGKARKQGVAKVKAPVKAKAAAKPAKKKA